MFRPRVSRRIGRGLRRNFSTLTYFIIDCCTSVEILAAHRNRRDTEVMREFEIPARNTAAHTGKCREVTAKLDDQLRMGDTAVIGPTPM